MKTFTMPYEEKNQFSSKDIRYIQLDPALREFYKYLPELESFEKVIQDKKENYSRDRRILLQSVLNKQYKHLPSDDAAQLQIGKLGSDHTFTVTTAHQPCLLTGPLYVIYKIASTINLANQLNVFYPEFHFIPLFVSGGEDHDLEEMNHFHMFGKRIEWNTDQSGAVGRMSKEGLDEVLDTVLKMSGNSTYAQQLNELLQTSLQSAGNYGEFFRIIIANLFHHSGLLILNMDEKDFKKEAIPMFKDELINHKSKSLVTQTQEKLEKIGFAQQAYAREINLFYFHEDQRLRLEKKGNEYHLVDGNLSFSEKELLQLLEKHPERFSPNVVLRPLYQEMLLPNLAYVGGGGEIAYWLERKAQFEYFGLNFPVLIRRNSVFWLDHLSSRNLKPIGFEPSEIFEDIDILINQFVLREAEDEISLVEEKQQLEAIFNQIAVKAQKLDPSILKTIKAEEAKHQKSIDHLEHKLLKAKKQQLDISLNKIRKVHEKIFPSSKPQERYDNFIMYYLRWGQEYVDLLLEKLNPFCGEVIVFQEED